MFGEKGIEMKDKKMVAVANLTVAGITRGNRYDVIEKSDRFIKIVLDNGKIGVRHIKAFNFV